MAVQKDPKDLLDSINFSAFECLNEQPNHPASNVLKQGYREDDGLFLESDTDEQLLIKVPFQQKTKLQAIAFKGPAESGPKVVKLYANRPSLGFSDVDSVPAAQQLELSEADLAACKQHPLKLVKFNNVDDLAIFVESNQSDADTTKIFKIVIYGSTGETFNVNEIKKQGEGQ